MDIAESQSISNWFDVVLRFLEINGYPKEQVLSELRLNKQLPNSSAFYPISQLSTLWLYAYEKFGPTVGILVAEQFKPYNWAEVGLLLQSSKNLDEFLKRICQFVPLISTAIQLDYQTHNENEKKFSIKFKEPVPLPVERIEACLLCGWKMANLIHVSSAQFLRFEHIRPRPKDTTPWESVFGKNIVWGKNESAIFFSNDEVFKTSNSVNEKLSKILEEELSTKLHHLYSSEYSYKVRNEILNLIQDGPPSLKQISKRLNISYRSLQRHLSDQGYSYRHILHSIQMNLAKEYLISTQYSLFEIALKVGFSNSSNFSNAFKKWTTVTPGLYRLRNQSISNKID